MKKPRLRTLVLLRKKDLRAAHPKSRDRLRHKLHVLLKAAQIKKELRAA